MSWGAREVRKPRVNVKDPSANDSVDYWECKVCNLAKAPDQASGRV